MTQAEALRSELHKAWLHELADVWRSCNERYLDKQLTPPVFRIDERQQQLGSWAKAARILSIGEHHIFEHAWEEVESTLRHEMAHQYVDECLGGDSRPHGEKFVQACALLEITPEASVNLPSDPATDRVLNRVRKLLALAQSDNRHEAEAAMATANLLLLRYNLSLPSAGRARRYRQVRLGRSAAALPLHEKLVAAILSEFFFVECIWAITYNARRVRHERILEVLGTDANLQMAEHVHAFLHAELKRLWRHNRPRLPRGRSTKREFMAGVLMGFSDKLRAERSVSASRGLVWVGDADLDEHVGKRFPHLRRLGGGGVRQTGAHSAGRDAGRNVHIRPPVGKSSSRGRLLPPK